MSTAEELKKLGNNAFTNKEYNKAAKIYRDAIKLDSSNPILYSNRAICFIKLEDWDRALKDCKAGIDLNPDTKTKIKLYYRMGLVYKGLKKEEDAISCFKNVLNFDSNNMATRKELDQIMEMSSQKKKIKLDNSTMKDIPIEEVDELPEFYKNLNNGNKKSENEAQNRNEKESDNEKSSESLEEEIINIFKNNKSKLCSKSNNDNNANENEISSHQTTLNLLSNLKSVPEEKKINAYKFVIEMSPMEYSKIFSASVLELEFMEFFLEASCYISKNDVISNWPTTILALLSEFSKTSRFSLTLSLCSRDKITYLLNATKRTSSDEIYSNYRSILEMK